MRKPPSVQLPALFVRLPIHTHDLLRDLAAAADESVSRYVVTLIESRRPGGAQLPPQRSRKAVEPQPIEVASDEPVKRKRGRPRKAVEPQPVGVAAEAAPVALPQLEEPPRRPRGRPRKVPLAEVVAVAPHKRQPRVDAAPVEEPVAVAAPVESRLDTLDRIRAALARLEEPPVEELHVVAGESRVVLEESP
jgi:hypothetical protein